MREIKVSPPLGFELRSPGSESQCATNELCHAKMAVLPTPSYIVSQKFIPSPLYLCDIFYEWSLKTYFCLAQILFRKLFVN